MYLLVYMTMQNGIEDSLKEKIFEPYFTTKHESYGIGLGLYMSYKIVQEKLKGNIFLENINYKYNGKNYTGAKFTISLPKKIS